MRINKNNQKNRRNIWIMIAIGLLSVGSFLFSAPAPAQAARASQKVDVNLNVLEGARIIIYDVGASNITTSAAKISWKTNFEAECEMSYGKDTSYSTGSFSESTLSKTHSQSLSGLDSGEKYYYKIYCESPIKTGQERDSFNFHTLLPAPVFSITIIGGDKAKIDGELADCDNWMVHLIFSGKVSFLGETSCRSNEKWQYITDHLEPGKYYVYATFENQDGDKGPTSSTHEFIIPKIIVPEEEVIKEEPKEILPKLENIIKETPEAEETIGKVTETAQTIEDVINENKIPLTIVTGAGLAAGALPFLFQLNSLGEIGLLLKGGFSIMIGFFINRKRRDWGIAYDIRNGKPISLAVVSIYNEDGKLAERKVTDSMGSYSFMVPSGRYMMRIEKKGYEFAPAENKLMSYYTNSYNGQMLEIKAEDVIRKDFPLRPAHKTTQTKFVSKKSINYISGIIFLGGFLYSVVALIVSPILINYVIIAIYIAAGAIRTFAGSTGSRWGSIVGKDGIQASFAVIKAYDKENGKMIARTISDEHGRYYLILGKGKYDLEVSSSVLSGQKWAGAIEMKERAAVKKKIKLT